MNQYEETKIITADNDHQNSEIDGQSELPSDNLTSSLPPDTYGMAVNEKEKNNDLNTETLAFAGFWVRFWAYLVDLAVIAGLKQLLVNPIVSAFNQEAAQGIFSLPNILSAAVFYLYFVLLTKCFGQTLGKMIFGLKVIPLKEKRLSWRTVIFREWIGRYISASIIILYLLVAFLPKKQGIHDYFADTAVIHEYYIRKSPKMAKVH